MATCNVCGKDAGYLHSVCPNCRTATPPLAADAPQPTLTRNPLHIDPMYRDGGKSTLKWIIGGALVLILGIAFFAILGGSGEKSPLCTESAEAAHYIAAKSANSNDVVQVTRDAIADRKYSELGDKVLASIGGVVALSIGRETPDEISEKIRSTCEQAASP